MQRKIYDGAWLIYKYLAYLMTGFLVIGTGSFVFCFVESVYHGPFPQLAFPLLYLILFFLPVSVSLLQLSCAYETTGPIGRDAFSGLNILLGVAGSAIMGFLQITHPNLEAFFSSTQAGAVIPVILLFVLGLNFPSMRSRLK